VGTLLKDPRVPYSIRRPDGRVHGVFILPDSVGAAETEHMTCYIGPGAIRGSRSSHFAINASTASFSSGLTSGSSP
jgi:hypothetical protein